MSAISRRDLNDLAKAARRASDGLDALSPKSETLADRLNSLDAKLGEFATGLSSENSSPESFKKARRFKMLDRWAPVVTLVATLSTLAAMVPAILGLQAAQESLVAAEAALQREQISQSFMGEASVCTSVKTDPISSEILGTTFSTVVTNTGRLPITILDVRSGSGKDNGPVEFFWLPLNASDEDPSSDPIYLEVGEAVALTVFIPGNSFEPILRFALSNGLPDQKATINEGANEIGFPATVSEAFDVLPSFCG